MRWKRLGNYPGSLGRYAWAERNIPVLTIELPATLPEAMPLQMDRFQDELSFLAR
jgi:murein peptide amidase A